MKRDAKTDAHYHPGVGEKEKNSKWSPTTWDELGCPHLLVHTPARAHTGTHTHSHTETRARPQFLPLQWLLRD